MGMGQTLAATNKHSFSVQNYQFSFSSAMIEVLSAAVANLQCRLFSCHSSWAERVQFDHLSGLDAFCLFIHLPQLQKSKQIAPNPNLSNPCPTSKMCIQTQFGKPA